MISILDNTITANGQTNLIREWRVWWRGPHRNSPLREELVDKCIKDGIDPEFNVVPVPTAIGDDNSYEQFLR